MLSLCDVDVSIAFLNVVHFHYCLMIGLRPFSPLLLFIYFFFFLPPVDSVLSLIRLPSTFLHFVHHSFTLCSLLPLSMVMANVRKCFQLLSFSSNGNSIGNKRNYNAYIHMCPRINKGYYHLFFFSLLFASFLISDVLLFFFVSFFVFLSIFVFFIVAAWNIRVGNCYAVD